MTLQKMMAELISDSDFFRFASVIFDKKWKYYKNDITARPRA